MTRRLPGPAASAVKAGIRGVDRLLASMPGLGPARLSQELSARKLLGPLHPTVVAERPPGRRLALTFDLDYQTDTDHLDGLVDLVGGAGARMSVCAIAALVEADPEPYRRALARGHELVNHSWTHPDNPVLDPDREFWHLDDSDIRLQISEANRIFGDVLGTVARGFRTPHFKDVQRMIPILDDDPEITYLSTALATMTPTGLPFRPARTPAMASVGHYHPALPSERPADLIQLPLTACPDHRWSPFCSYHHLRRPVNAAAGAGMHDLQVFESHWVELLEAADDLGYLCFYFDPHDVMAGSAETATFRRCIELSQEKGWEVVAMGDVVDAWSPFLTSGTT